MPVLTTLAEMADDGCLVKPLFYQWVIGAESIPLNLLVERPTQRAPDGWFHASAHPLATPRQLWLWLAGKTVPEQMGYTSLMAVMFGSLSHAVFEAFLDWMGVSEPLAPGQCPACGRPRRPLRARPSRNYCTEHGFIHQETRARCHLDGILVFDGERYGFDLKTIWPLGLRGSKDREAVRDMDAAQFKERWPHYWAQMQECMRLSGLRRYIVLFLTMGSPWELREFHIDFDPVFAAKTEEKYRAVIDCWRRGVEILA